MIDGNLKFAYGTGASIALIAIAMVFVILFLIIILTELVAKAFKSNEKEEVETKQEVKSQHVVKKASLDLNDEDATVAALVASIDYRSKYKGDVQVVSIREI